RFLPPSEPESLTVSIAVSRRATWLLVRGSAYTWLGRLPSHTGAPLIWISTRKAAVALGFVSPYLFRKVSWAMRLRSNVLVVDDEPPLRKVLQTSLTARGFAVAE